MREQLSALLREVISFGVSVEPRTAQLTLMEALSALSDTLDGTARLHLLLDRAYDYPDVPDALQQLAQWLTRQEGHDPKLARALFLLSYRHMQARRCGGLNRRGIGRSNRAESIERLPLDEVYVIPNLRTEKDVARDDEGDALRLLDDDYVSEEKRSEALKRFEKQKGERWRRERPQETFELGKALQRARHTVILGGPGSGKSTLIRYVTRACALGGDAMRERLGWEEERTPVSVPVSLFAEALQSNARLTVERFLLDTLREDGGEPLAAIVADELKAGRVVVLLDGLDEVPEASVRHQVAEAIRDFLREFSSARVIMTSRPYGYARILPATTPGDLPHYELLPFTPEQVEEFLRDWHTVLDKSQPLPTDVREQKRNVEAVLQEIRAKESTQELASNPLLLVILTIICWEDNHLPEQRVVLYKRIVELLAGQWNELRKQVPGVAKGDDGLTEQSLIRALGYVAAHMRAGHRFLKREALEKVFAEALEDMGEPRPEQLARTYLEAAARRAGILEEFGHDHFTFWHPTFEEYLTAYHFTRRGFNTKEKLLEIRHDPRYKEVLLLTLGYIAQIDGIKKESTELVRSIWKDDLKELDIISFKSLLIAVDCVCDKSCVQPDLAYEIIMKLISLVEKYPSYPFVNALHAISLSVPKIGMNYPELFDSILPPEKFDRNIINAIYRFILHCTETNNKCKEIWNEVVRHYNAMKNIEKPDLLRLIFDFGNTDQIEFVKSEMKNNIDGEDHEYSFRLLMLFLEKGNSDDRLLAVSNLNRFVNDDDLNKAYIAIINIIEYGNISDKVFCLNCLRNIMKNKIEEIPPGAPLLLLKNGDAEDRLISINIYRMFIDNRLEVLQNTAATNLLEYGDAEDKQKSIDICMKLLGSRFNDIRNSSRLNIFKHGGDDDKKRAILRFKELLLSNFHDVISYAAGSLFLNGDDECKKIAMQKSKSLLVSFDDNIRLNAISQLLIGDNDNYRVNLLNSYNYFLESDNEEIRQNILILLLVNDSLDIVIELLQNKNVKVRSAAMSALHRYMAMNPGIV